MKRIVALSAVLLAMVAFAGTPAPAAHAAEPAKAAEMKKEEAAPAAEVKKEEAAPAAETKPAAKKSTKKSAKKPAATADAATK